MKRLSRNVFSILLSDAARRLLGFFAVTYLTRTITVNDFGAMNIGLTLLSYGLMLSSGGLGSLGTREVVAGREPALVARVLSARLVNALMVYAVIAAASLLLIRDPLTLSLTLLFACSLFTNAFFLDWYFQGKEEMAAIGWARIAAAVVYLAMVLLLVRDASHVLWVPAAAVASDLAVTVPLILVYRRRYERHWFTFSLRGWWWMMRQAVPIGAGSILAHLSINLPPLVLGIALSNVEVGLYSAATKLVFFLLMLDRVLGAVLLPASARFFADSKEALGAAMATAMKWILIAALPVAVGGTFVASTLVPAVFGAGYAEASDVFRVLIWYFFFTLFHTVFANALVAAREERTFAVTMAVSAALYAVFVISGSIVWGMPGAAAGVVAAEGVTVVLMHRRCAEFIRIPLPANAVRVILAAVCMALVLFFLPHLRLALAIPVGAAVYTGCLVAFRGVTKHDLSELAARI